MHRGLANEFASPRLPSSSRPMRPRLEPSNCVSPTTASMGTKKPGPFVSARGTGDSWTLDRALGSSTLSRVGRGVGRGAAIVGGENDALRTDGPLTNRGEVS